jgi:hypothetical protein
MSRVVCASDYGGPGDPTSGTHGYHGDNLVGKMAFAELRMGTALGNLPYRAKVRVEYNGRSVIAEKLDIGLGGAGCGGHSRDIDLWYQTAQALGFNGLGPVTVTLPREGSTGTMRTVGALNLPGEKQFEELGENAGEELFSNPLTGGGLFGEGILGTGGAGGAINSLGGIGHLLNILTTKAGWIKIGKVLVGLFLLITGVLGMANVSSSTVIAPVEKAAELAAVA